MKIFNPKETKKHMNPEDEMLEFLILQNALEVAGVDPRNGEFLYSFTPKIKEVMPELYKDHLDSINKEVMNLWEKGFVSLDLLQEDPTIRITSKALQIESIEELSQEEQWCLAEVKRVLSIE
jgi:hypothetical protein